MRTTKYIKEYWQEMWNPDSRQWQIIDRILFPVLPALTFTAYLLPRAWGSTMSNLVWIVPLAVWVMFFVLFVPYRLVSKYHNKYEDTVSELLKFHKAGSSLKKAIYDQRADTQSVEALYREWEIRLCDCFLRHRELGEAHLLGIYPEKKDIIKDSVPSSWGENRLTEGRYLWVDAQLGLIKSLIQDLLKRG
jgi:hypothetical protein